jgi:predicted ATPase
MKIKSIHLKHFKRFTDLKIQHIPENTKLVVMLGPNGCGKSSLFDGLISWHKQWKGHGNNFDPNYHHKKGIDEITNNERVQVEFYKEPSGPEEKKKAFCFRTAHRNDPLFRLNQLNKMGSQLDETRFDQMIHNDAAVSQNYQRLASQAFKNAFTYDAAITLGEFRQIIIGDIKAAIRRIFPDLDLNDLGDPLEEGTFFFDKGKSQKFEYRNLSGGEKASFDIILDLVVKIRDFDKTIFCIDEPELHMNTRLQGDLLQEIFNLVNDNSQIWIATHSIGMMRKAKDLATEHPDKVIFLDFDQKDFDQDQIIEPAKVTRAFWENALRVALDDLADLITPKQIVICEGEPLGTGNSTNIAHDAKCLDKIFADEFPDTKFLAGGNCHDVENNRHALIGAIEALSRGTKIIRIIDKDDRSKDQINELKSINSFSNILRIGKKCG